MIGYIKLDDDGGIEVYEISGEGRELIVSISSAVFVLLDFFNEGRVGFSWDGDAERVAEMLLWRLEDHDLMPVNMSEYHRQINQLCVPGGPTGNPFNIELTTAA
jgi:hypothetical protein